jgi:tRNA(Ile)-lysidine synthase
MHLIRGASPVGLSGMRERDGALIRPLLPFSRAQIEQYAQENHLPHVEDETNADIAYTRNYIRHELIPCMEKLNPRAVEAIGRAAELARRQSDFVRQEALRVLRSRMYGAALADVSDLHPGLRSEVIAQYLRAQGTPEFSAADIVRIESLLAGGVGRRVSLGKELFERDTNGVRRVIMEPAGSGRWALHSGENETPLGRFTLRTGKVPKNLNLGKYAQVFDADKIRAPLFVRTRRDGDRLALLGGGKRKLSDILIDKKVPRALRDSVPLIVMGEEILWAVGAAPGKTCAVVPESVRALVIEYQPLKEKNDAVFKG